MAAGIKLSKEELLKLYNMDLEALLELSSKYVKDTVEFCSIVNARNGKCSQNCKYCAQSSFYRTDIESYPLIPVVDVIKAAEESVENKADRFAIVTSGKTPDEEDFDKILEMIKALNKVEGIKSCASIGILNEEQAKALADAGLKRFHHNINTAKSYYPSVWVEMAMELAEIEPDSIPINILMPIPETPFENYYDKIDEENILRTLAVFKIANPNSILRFCGGRMRLSEENQEKALKTCVEGILIGNYLTTLGREPHEDIETIAKLGKKIHIMS